MNNTEAITELVDLFFVIAKQDRWNHNIDKPYLQFFFRHYNNNELITHLSSQYEEKLNGIAARENQQSHQVTAELDSVKTLAITKRFNKFISDEERLVVLGLLCEQARTGDFITTNRNEIIDAINSVFGFEKNIYSGVKNFILSDNAYADADENTLILEAEELSLYNRIRGVKHRQVQWLEKPVAVKKLPLFPELLLVKNLGEIPLQIDNTPIDQRRFYIMRKGETLGSSNFSFTFDQLNDILNKKFVLDSLYIEKTEKMPLIDFNVSSNVLRISGVSIPEDAFAFYKPILHWLGLYLQNKPAKTEMVFELEFFNTVSSRLFLEIMKVMQKLKDSGTEVTIRWLYMEDDEDIQEAGENYAEMVDVNFLVEPK